MKRRDILLGASSIATAAVVVNSQLTTATQSDPMTAATAAKSVTGAGKTIQITKDLPGYYVTPVGTGKFPTVIVLMEAFGLNKWCKSICDRLAESGFAAIAPDFYRGTSYAYTDRQGAIAKLKSLKDDAIMSDVGKSIEFLTGKSEVNANAIGIIGFCSGGRYTFLTNAVYPSQIKAAVAFYGGGIDATADPVGRKSLIGRVDTMQSPIMLMYGAEDKSITADEQGRIATALSKAKKRYILNLFPKAGHGFMSSDRSDSYSPEAAAEAWMMTTGFLKQNLNPKKTSKTST
jgi:carboxymethylenebutenolidase